MSAENLFNFDRDLPAPFDTLGSKRVKVCSKYSDKTYSTLCAPMAKGILAFCGCKSGNGQGAVGLIDHKAVCEYKSKDPDMYHLVVFDFKTGKALATVYNTMTEMGEDYTLHKSARDGSAVIMAMLPTLIQDDEFKENFDAFYAEYQAGYPVLDKAAEYMGILCDNIYRRVKDENCSAHVKFVCDKAGHLTRINKTQMDSSVFEPRTVIAGEFTILAHGGAAPVYSPTSAPDINAFVGKYKLNPMRMLSPLEQELIPVLESWYILPNEVVSICKHAKASTVKAAPMRNFLLRGPAGTGKTEGSKAIAAGLGLPYMKYTCSANTEIFDFVGQVFPETDAVSTGDAILDQERQQLKDMGGITYSNVAKLMNLPNLDDLDYDPEGVYQALTGINKPNISTQECIGIIMEKVADKIQQLSRVKTDEKSSGQTFTYVETDFIKALKQGYVIEIQEPSTIMQPGVLVGLNSLLEQSGSITLPTGEIIKRHPDTVVIVTTNVSYEGCRNMNQSVVDRMSLVQDIDLPSAEIMVQRAMSVTGCEDDILVSNMVQVVNDMATYCRQNGITDGNCGMRGLIDWIISTEITDDAYTSALYTVISKATSDENDREALITTVLESLFKPSKKAS